MGKRKANAVLPDAPVDKVTGFPQRVPLSDFRKRVLRLLCRIPPGYVATYGAMAQHLGSAPRAVGQALRNNPYAPTVPCHRVIASNYTIGGFAGSTDVGGCKLSRKRELLTSEGLSFDQPLPTDPIVVRDPERTRVLRSSDELSKVILPKLQPELDRLLA